MNDYKPKQIQRALTSTTHTEDTTKDNQPASKAYLPYTQTTYGRLSRMLGKHNIKSVALPHRKIASYLPPFKKL